MLTNNSNNITNKAQ